MDILYTYKDVPAHLQGSVIAIGNFDGVHLGHKAILALTKQIALDLQAKAGVMVFEPHPKAFFAPQTPFFYLSDISKKLELLKECGLDVTTVLPFDHNLAQLSAQDFVQKILVQGLNVRHVIVGYDFHFGKGREGTAEKLKDLSEYYNFGINILSKQSDGHEVYSSTRIRQLLINGNVSAASHVLGYYWRISGKVIDGAKRGSSLLGIPTANMALKVGQTLGHGIYAVRVYKDHACYLGAAYIGRRPTFDNGQAGLEVFLFDFEGDLYGQEIEVEFIEHIREDAKFETLDALKQQMHQDCEHAKQILQALQQKKSAV
ncbi:MAG: bifunctional riboflavin kinase/FAD synthetase [Pseudomonadota bacterium]